MYHCSAFAGGVGSDVLECDVCITHTHGWFRLGFEQG
jgi:hypothetical protein